MDGITCMKHPEHNLEVEPQHSIQPIPKLTYALTLKIP
jgi:hypothetical protein